MWIDILYYIDTEVILLDNHEMDHHSHQYLAFYHFIEFKLTQAWAEQCQAQVKLC